MGVSPTLSPWRRRPADAPSRRGAPYSSRGGVSINLEQQITEELGLFARAGFADGGIEPYEFTDIDRTAAAGLSLNGKQWGRPDDTLGVAGVVNGITKVHQEFLNNGGLGILIGDGMLPHPGPEQIVETYYNYALSSSTRPDAGLSVRRQSRLQHRPRAGQRDFRAVPLADVAAAEIVIPRVASLRH